MKLITWNVLKGGGSRVQQILGQLRDSRPDVTILTEFRVGATGSQIQDGLHRMGLEYQTAPEVKPGINSVLLAARFPITAIPVDGLPPEDHHRCVLARCSGINLAAPYFPQKEEKSRLFEFILGWPESFLRERSILMGDFNTGKHYLDEQGATFSVAHYMDQLEEAGWIDAWRLLHGNEREYTWQSHSGNGFRLDHAFVSPPLRESVVDARYSHNVREAGISDHSLMEVQISDLGE